MRKNQDSLYSHLFLLLLTVCLGLLTWAHVGMDYYNGHVLGYLPGDAPKVFKILILLFFIVLIGGLSFVLGHHIGRSKQRGEKLADASNWTVLMTIRDIVVANALEAAFLFLVTLLLLVNLSAWIENLGRVTPTSLAPTVVALLLTLVSTIIAMVGMHYAFLAEEKSEQTLRNSMDLLSEKREFLDDFRGFMGRINRKIGDPDGLLKDINLNQTSEMHFYNVKCMFLTPFLGHAGLRSEDRDLWKRYQKLQENLRELINNPFCSVKIMTLDEEKIVNWYAQIQWVEQAKFTFEQKRVNGPLSGKDIEEISDRVYTILNTEKGFGGPLTVHDTRDSPGARQAVPCFTDLANRYKSDYAGGKGKENIPRLEVSHVGYMPFQLFLVTENIIENPDLFPSKSCFKRHPGSQQIIEGGKFVVLSFVGDKTYFNLIDDIAKGSAQRAAKTGIEELLQNLHAALYSEDPRICNILNNHFEHYWRNESSSESDSTRNRPQEKQAPCPHYPIVDPDLWSKIKIEDYLPEPCIEMVKQSKSNITPNTNSNSPQPSRWGQRIQQAPFFAKIFRRKNG